MVNFLQEIRVAVRSLLKSPRFTLTIIVTLALGVGGNAIILSAARSTFVTPLPFPASDRIVRIDGFTQNPTGGRAMFGLHGAEIESLRQLGDASPFATF